MYSSSERLILLRPGAIVCLFAAWLFLVASSAAQTDNPDTAPPPAPSIARDLSGVVVNSVTGEPVRRAIVQVAASTGVQWSVLTDAEGRFEFPALPESEMAVAAHKPGFFNDLELHPETFQPEMMHVGANSQPFVLKLLPEGMISGHVATLKGDPIEDSPVRLLREHIVDGRKRWELRGQAVTDEDGQFRIANLVPGRYLLATGPNLPGARMFGPARLVRQEGFGTIFYPGVADLESASPLAISAGQQVQADFALKAEPIFKVTGLVIGLAPGAGAGLQFMSKAGEVLPAPVNLDIRTGKFEAAIPGGSYVLHLSSSDGSGNVVGADLPLVVNSDVEGVSLVLGSSITLPVHLDRRPARTAAEQAAAIGTGGREQAFSTVRLTSTESRIDYVELLADANEKGALAFHNLMPGRYSLDIAATPPWYVRSATSGTIDLLREDLVVASGHRPEPLEVVLRDDGCGVHGRIWDNGQPSGGAVLLFSSHASLAHAQVSVIPAGAEFSFVGLAPGDYKLLAFDSLDGLEYRNPEALSPYLSRAVSIALQANETVSVNVERESSGK